MTSYVPVSLPKDWTEAHQKGLGLRRWRSDVLA
jgi:hypothetical protein